MLIGRIKQIESNSNFTSFSDKLLAFASFLLVFSYSLSFIFDIITGIKGNSVSYFTAFLGLFVYLYFAKEIIHKKLVINFQTFFAILLIILYTVGLFISSIKYSYTISHFSGVFKSFYVRGIPCFIAGILMREKRMLKKIELFFVPIILVVAISLVLVLIKNPTSSMMLYASLGIDRQTLSYVSSYFIAFIFYYYFNFDELECIALFKSFIFRLLIGCALLICIFSLFAGGGRGAMCVVIAILLYYLISYKPHGSKRGLIFGVFIICIFIIAFRFLSTTSIFSQGYNRIINFFMGSQDQSSKERMYLYSSAIQLFQDNPFLGYGVGGSLGELNIWSHNVFLDIMIDYGILGLLVFAITVILSFYRILKLTKISRSEEIAFIFGLCSFIELLFSGSYLSDAGIWYLFGYCSFEVKYCRY